VSIIDLLVENIQVGNAGHDNLVGEFFRIFKIQFQLKIIIAPFETKNF
jgi:hypothetical protein